jgi:hypothetical protein
MGHLDASTAAAQGCCVFFRTVAISGIWSSPEFAGNPRKIS